MPLAPSTRLGPYEILARLGAGGMGEVYRARDSRLGREVALKILPEEFAGDRGRRSRFEQEARAAAALNHPNILGLYDIGDEGGVAYIVTELVAGETLAALIERGPVPTRRLLDIAVQTADGMAAAHTARITHRDLKPPNIMIAGDSRVKILDFGLARQSSPAATHPDETMTVAQTEPGMVVGTVNYMSPEQVRAQPVDYRSDQFSFGLILYEMAAGRRAFERPEAVQTMSAILTEEAPPMERSIPGPLRWAMDRCLAKEPADRYESTRDLFQELRSLRDHFSEASTTQAAAVPAGQRRRFPWRLPAAFAMGVAAALVALLLWPRPEIPDQSAYRFTPLSFEPGGQTNAIWSPDGKAVAYAARGGSGPYQVFIRYLDSPTPVQVTHTAENVGPAAWTPDGKRILLEGERTTEGLRSIATVGGEPEPFMSAAYDAWDVAISPDNQAVAGFKAGDDGRYGIWISSPPGAPLKKYSPDPFATPEVYNGPHLKFSPDGKRILLFLNGVRHREEAWLLPYPPDPSQPPRQALPNLQAYNGTPTFSWMPDNRHIVFSFAPSPDASSQLWMADTVTGERHALTSGTTSRTAPAVSPDGRKIVFVESAGNFDVVSVDLRNAAAHGLIATARDESMPAWAARQPVLVFVTDRNGFQEIWIHREGSGDRPLVTPRDFPPGTTQWFMGPALSPDADRVIYSRIESSGGGTHLWISAVAGGAPVPVTNDGTFSEFPGSWSTDGNWFTYLALKDGKLHLLKVKTSGQATPTVVKTDPPSPSDGVPSWSPGGDWILYAGNLFSPDGKTIRPLGEHHSEANVFSKDGKLVYGMRADHERELLFSVDIATGAEKVIGDVGKDFRPGSFLNPAKRFSLAPDGQSLVYGTAKRQDNLWMLEGFAARPGIWARLGLR